MSNHFATRATECGQVLELLIDAPAEGYTQEEIATKLDWSLRSTNIVLCDLTKQVGNHKVRDRSTRKNVTKYFLKLRG